jgi:hypothetical protein
MRRIGVLLIAVIVAACSASDVTGPVNPWLGTWTLESVNGVAVPASTLILGYQERVVSRVLEIRATGLSHWRDSTLSALVCFQGQPGPGQPMCNASGSAVVDWDGADSALTVTAHDPVLGYVVRLKHFVLQADGTLLKTDDSQVERYRKS